LKIVLLGADGQLGRELKRTCPENMTLTPFEEKDLDITDTDKVHRTINQCCPDWVINAAAYTAVDQAESDSDTAYRVNRDGPAAVASAVADIDSKMIQISTDFVFSGARGAPYLPLDEATPLSVYGSSKSAGEQRCLEILRDRALIVRTAWLYSAYGHNFVLTMLRLLKEKDCLRVVSDQVGTPTWANGLARAIWRAVNRNLNGIHHWTDAGVAGWYDFAVAIQEESIKMGLLTDTIPIHPINTKDYPTAAPRPCYSVLDKTATWSALDVQPLHWRQALRRMLEELSANPSPTPVSA
jgi:dTDP-4-dehydrorhamnose reductase